MAPKKNPTKKKQTHIFFLIKCLREKLICPIKLMYLNFGFIEKNNNTGSTISEKRRKLDRLSTLLDLKSISCIDPDLVGLRSTDSFACLFQNTIDNKREMHVVIFKPKQRLISMMNQFHNQTVLDCCVSPKLYWLS